MIERTNSPLNQVETPGSGSVSPPQLHRQLWLREMERAQTEAWFLPMTRGDSKVTPPATAGLPSTTRIGVQSESRDAGNFFRDKPHPERRVDESHHHRQQINAAAKTASNSAGVVVGGQALQSLQGANPGVASHADLRHSQSPLCAITEPLAALAVLSGSWQPPVHSAAIAAKAPSSSDSRSSQISSAAQMSRQVHVHLETNEKGSAVWLGVPASLLDLTPGGAWSVAAWIEHIQRGFVLRGIEVQQVVVNGQTVWAASPVGTNPWGHRTVDPPSAAAAREPDFSTSFDKEKTLWRSTR